MVSAEKYVPSKESDFKLTPIEAYINQSFALPFDRLKAIPTNDPIITPASSIVAADTIVLLNHEIPSYSLKLYYPEFGKEKPEKIHSHPYFETEDRIPQGLDPAEYIRAMESMMGMMSSDIADDESSVSESEILVDSDAFSVASYSDVNEGLQAPSESKKARKNTKQKKSLNSNSNRYQSTKQSQQPLNKSGARRTSVKNDPTRNGSTSDPNKKVAVGRRLSSFVKSIMLVQVGSKPSKSSSPSFRRTSVKDSIHSIINEDKNLSIRNSITVDISGQPGGDTQNRKRSSLKRNSTSRKVSQTPPSIIEEVNETIQEHARNSSTSRASQGSHSSRRQSSLRTSRLAQESIPRSVPDIDEDEEDDTVGYAPPKYFQTRHIPDSDYNHGASPEKSRRPTIHKPRSSSLSNRESFSKVPEILGDGTGGVGSPAKLSKRSSSLIAPISNRNSSSRRVSHISSSNEGTQSASQSSRGSCVGSLPVKASRRQSSLRTPGKRHSPALKNAEHEDEDDITGYVPPTYLQEREIQALDEQGASSDALHRTSSQIQKIGYNKKSSLTSVPGKTQAKRVSALPRLSISASLRSKTAFDEGAIVITSSSPTPTLRVESSLRAGQLNVLPPTPTSQTTPASLKDKKSETSEINANF